MRGRMLRMGMYSCGCTVMAMEMKTRWMKGRKRVGWGKRGQNTPRTSHVRPLACAAANGSMRPRFRFFKIPEAASK
jgi:hypothetical protein